ncbi:MAG TPA: effector binding domain-containing protein [Candidatus Wallbacteria bacterium]|nr:effector binding domain-containing protein [Candidatus Wallbacteria bacterium]
MINYVKQIQLSIDDIESKLDEELDLDAIAASANFSKFHYHRIFHAMVGEPVMEYVRKRRLIKAARELMRTDKKVIDIALSSGFNSHETFSRAFKKFFGIAPMRCRKNKISLDDLENSAAIKNLKGGIIMQPKFLKKDGFMVVGLECVTTVKENKENKIIPKLWDKFLPRMAEIKNHSDCPVCYGVCSCDNPGDAFSYISGIEVKSLDAIPKGMAGRKVAPSKYAVFTHHGPTNRIYETLDYIYGTWLPASGCELNKLSCDFELYDERFNGGENSEFDIYIPIK